MYWRMCHFHRSHHHVVNYLLLFIYEIMRRGKNIISTLSSQFCCFEILRHLNRNKPIDKAFHENSRSSLTTLIDSLANDKWSGVELILRHIDWAKEDEDVKLKLIVVNIKSDLWFCAKLDGIQVWKMFWFLHKEISNRWKILYKKANSFH